MIEGNNMNMNEWISWMNKFICALGSNDIVNNMCLSAKLDKLLQ